MLYGTMFYIISGNLCEVRLFVEDGFILMGCGCISVESVFRLWLRILFIVFCLVGVVTILSVGIVFDVSLIFCLC